MVSRNFEMAMQTIRNGNMDEGARLMRIVLKEELPPNIRAVALLWLAETNHDMKFKLDCYREAQQYDPNNQDVATRLSSLLASQLPPSGNTPTYGMSPISTQTAPQVPVQPSPQMQPPPTAQPPNTAYPGYPQYGNVAPTYTPQPMPTAQPIQQPIMPMPTTDPLAQMPVQPRLNDPFSGQPPLDIPMIVPTVGISGGPGGMATGFFVSARGMIVTTRSAVGMNTQLNVVLPNGQNLMGYVVRSFSLFDVALIRVNVFLRQLSAFSSTPVIMDETPLTIVNYAGRQQKTTKRPTKQAVAAHWFPTLVKTLDNSVGGDVVLDERGMVLGMMTRNAFRGNNYLYGLHISAILQALDVYSHEMQQNNGAETYCVSCGHISRAGMYGGFYCETCGTTLPQFTSDSVARFPQANQNLSALYQELNVPCKACGARAGFYNGQCLRCGKGT
jgi:hypothetical protein